MVLFIILITILLILAVIGVFLVSLGGAVFTVIFGDVIVCIVLIILIIRFLIKRKKR